MEARSDGTAAAAAAGEASSAGPAGSFIDLDRSDLPAASCIFIPSDSIFRLLEFSAR
jgi:hypothetical protein